MTIFVRGMLFQGVLFYLSSMKPRSSRFLKNTSNHAAIFTEINIHSFFCLFVSSRKMFQDVYTTDSVHMALWFLLLKCNLLKPLFIVCSRQICYIWRANSFLTRWCLFVQTIEEAVSIKLQKSFNVAEKLILAMGGKTDFLKHSWNCLWNTT